ncbi:MAG: HAD family phosphatase [Bacteroidota bacterium]
MAVPIRAVIFDFGKVVCDFDIGRFLSRAALYSTKSPAELRAVMTSATPIATHYETGEMTSDEFYQAICNLASLDMPKAKFIDAYTDIFTPIPRTFELIKRLKGSYRLALLSNTSEWHFKEGIRPVAVFPLFDTVTLSFQVKAMKPDPRIYQDAIQKLDLPADACIYIDDIAEFVEAGRVLGLHGIHYTSHEQLVTDLRLLGVRAE